MYRAILVKLLRPSGAGRLRLEVRIIELVFLGVRAMRKMSSLPPGRYRGGGWGDGGRRGGGGGIFQGGWGGRVLLVGCGRPCDHQRQAPAVHVVRERGGAFDSVLRQWLDIPVVLQRRVPTVQIVQKTGEIPQVVFLDTVGMPVVVQRQVLGS